MNLTRSEKNDLFDNLLGVCMTSALLSGAMAGGGLGVVVVALTMCITIAIIITAKGYGS
jgi:hypothetical protein